MNNKIFPVVIEISYKKALKICLLFKIECTPLQKYKKSLIEVKEL